MMTAIMEAFLHLLCALYGWLIRGYPPGFRAAFGDEMRAVFADAASDAGSRGFGPLLALCFRELRDWPGAVAAAYQARLFRMGSQLNSRGGRDLMMKDIVGMVGVGENGDGSWAIGARSRAVLAALPPLVLGVGLALSALINGGSYFDLALWQQALVILLTLLPVGVLGVGGAIALLRALPDWGYTWASSALLAGAVLFKVLVEESAEVGAAVVSPSADVVIALVIVLAGGVVLVIAALRGWAQAGLTSIGFAATFGITTLSMVRAAPFHRSDLVLFAAPLGLLQATLTYRYVRGRGANAMRWLALVSIWVLNSAPILLAHRVWQPWLAARGRTSPLAPLLIIVTILAWAGPIAGRLGRPVRRALHRG
jgi:hypothetical protein